MKKLFRSRVNKQIAGVCGGLAQYFNCDATIIRLAWVLISLVSASVPGLLIYLVCALIIPEEPDPFETTGYYHNDNQQNQ